MSTEWERFWEPVEAHQKHMPLQRWQLKDVGRNDKCPCGSLKKFKQCCLGRIK